MAQSTRPLLFPVIALAAIVLVTAGCDSPPRHRLSDDIEHPEPRPIALQGEATFFNGRLLANATLGRGLRGGYGKSGSDDDSSGSGSGGGRHSGGGGGRGGGRRGGSQGGSDGGSSDADAAPAPRAFRSGSHLPPVALRLHLRNLSKESLDIRILDVNSDLGNFVARPDHVELAPDQVVDLDPMISQLGVTADELPVTVRLSAGNEKEEHVITLHSVAPPEGATPPQSPPAAAPAVPEPPK